MQKKVKEFNDKTPFSKGTPVYARLLDIQSEMGELNKEYLKSSDYGTGDFVLSEDFKMEYGDVIYSLLSLANELEINAEDCLDKAISKYESRIKKKNTMGSEN